MNNPAIIRINPLDNVAIATAIGGIGKGDSVVSGIVAIEDIPMAHKIALCDVHPGDSIIRYGYKIGTANRFIPVGSWVQEQMLETPEAPSLDEIKYSAPIPNPVEQLQGFTFEGYRNEDGSVGTKNILGISMSVHCVAGFANHIITRIKNELLPSYPNVDDAIALSHTYGCGIAINAPAAIIPIRTLHNLARNPNLGGEILVLALGCEKLRPEKITGEEAESDILYMQDESLTGFEEMMQAALQMAERHLKKLNARKRETCPISDLIVGMQCGGSDAFSGISGNPVAGFAADLIVRAGGTVLFSEVTEVRDAVEQLVARAADEEVAAREGNALWAGHGTGDQNKQQYKTCEPLA